MEMIIMLAVIAALIALVYWKNVKNDVSVSAGQRPEEQEVTAKLDYFSEATGWHATFYNGSVLCHGVFVNLSEGLGRRVVVSGDVPKNEVVKSEELGLTK